MLSTGDVQNYLRKLQTELRTIKFRDVDYKSLQTGNPCEFLKIYHYVFVDYNPLFAKTLLDKCNCDFYGKTDSHFMDTVYKALRDYFSYKPPITKDQFFTTGFAERKLQMACDIIGLVRQEYREAYPAPPTRRSGSASARLSHGDKPKKRIPSGNQQSHVTNIFQPLRDMSLEGNGHLHDEPFVLDQRNGNDPKQQHIEKWLDGSEYETTLNHRPRSEMNNEPITALTINRLEEQVQMLKVKVEEINARLENISSIIEEIHPGQGSLSAGDLSNFNARLVLVENELAMLRRKGVGPTNDIRSAPSESKSKSSFIPQGILIDSDDDEERVTQSYAVAEPVPDFDIVERARSLLENAEQCNRNLIKTIQTKN